MTLSYAEKESKVEWKRLVVQFVVKVPVDMPAEEVLQEFEDKGAHSLVCIKVMSAKVEDADEEDEVTC